MDTRAYSWAGRSYLVEITNWITKNIYYNQDEYELAHKLIARLIANGWDSNGEDVGDGDKHEYCTQLIKNI